MILDILRVDEGEMSFLLAVRRESSYTLLQRFSRGKSTEEENEYGFSLVDELALYVNDV